MRLLSEQSFKTEAASHPVKTLKGCFIFTFLVHAHEQHYLKTQNVHLVCKQQETLAFYLDYFHHLVTIVQVVHFL